MSSTSNTTPSNAAAVPRYSTTAPPPYTSSDIQSVASKNSTSKSVLEKMFKRCKIPYAIEEGLCANAPDSLRGGTKRK
ncbi:hypothetical protein EJ02DRAFT_451514 [Clathrospora elynae]|uniref:Uncharacterized protein n=1 Tax=Clathrospora elynae TaxID=706981 RepID=A0A6A5SYY1_9PLEO|nr:hypothetical protein EJ02DRAFT_451514 [Clathrospora elynae]